MKAASRNQSIGRWTSIPDPCRSLAKLPTPAPTQANAARPNDKKRQPLLPSGNSAIFGPRDCADHALAANNINPLAITARHRKPTEFHVDHCTTWHRAITTAASRPGATIDHPAENTAFKINATIEYCTNIVTMAQAIGTATSTTTRGGQRVSKVGLFHSRKDADAEVQDC